MTIKVAINGFGRIGRLAFRQMFGNVFENVRYEIVAINDLTAPSMLAHLLKYDTAQGRYALAGTIDCDYNALIVDGVSIPVFAEPKPAALPWADLGVDVVLECTGFFANKDKAAAHLEAGAKKVIISAPAGNDLPTVVYGVNEQIVKASDTIISAASCTTNCLAPMAYYLHKLCPIEKGYMTTTHAYTADQNIQDGPHRKADLRRARAGAANIVPNTTGAAKAIGLVIPELSGRLDGAAVRVPVISGSLVDLLAICKGTVTKDEVNAAMKAAASPSFGYTEEELVSSDIVGTSEGSIFDATLTKVTSLEGGNSLVKVSAWYDNENGYTTQMVRLINHIVKLG